jgi:hypothetical protein
MARAEDRKTKQKPSQKRRGISRGQGRGAAEGVVCTCYKKLQPLRKLCFAIAARAATLRW